MAIYLVVQIIRTEANEGFDFYLTLFFPFMLTMSNGALLPEMKKRKEKKPSIQSKNIWKQLKSTLFLFWFRARIKFVGFVYVNTSVRCAMETVVIKIRRDEEKRGVKYAQCAIYHNKKRRKKKIILIVHIIVVFLILRVLGKQSTKT